MAQLSDDCFAFGGPLMRVEEAVRLIGTRIQPVAGIETVAVGAALGRVLAEPVAARVAVPGFDNSAVDGYAVRHADLAAAGDSRLPVGLRIPAGRRGVPALPPGTAARIFTGAPMPDGADTVFMQEDVREEDGHVHLPAGLKRGSNRRFAGEDFAVGAPLVAAGTRLDPRHLAALSAAGETHVRVRRPVRVALFSTGDELVAAGDVLPAGAQYDSNRTLLAALAARRGVQLTDLGILPDRADVIADALGEAAKAHDVILTSGGVSTGEEDHVKAAVERKGALNFWRLAIKPGRPVAMGTLSGAAYVGLPGNPVAAFVTFVRLAGPLIDRLGGGEAVLEPGLPALSGFSYRKKAGRREYLRGTVRPGGSAVVVDRFARDGAALISSLIESDGLIELDEEATDIAPGKPVGFLPYRLLM